MMANSIMLIDSGDISQERRMQIDSSITSIIKAHRNNSAKINEYALDSVMALSIAESRSDELASQNFLKRFVNNLSGKNNALRADVDNNFAEAQHASRKMIQALAEQNLMSFELTIAINNKLNCMMLRTDKEINRIHQTLNNFFKNYISDYIQLTNRIGQLEQNVRILNWVNTIEYLSFNGMPYSELNEIEKLVMVAGDFYSLTQGHFNMAECQLIKKAMESIGLSIMHPISYKEFLMSIDNDPSLLNKLLDEGGDLIGFSIEPHQASILKGIEKLRLLSNEEKYITDTVCKLAKIQDEAAVRIDLVSEFLRENAFCDTDKSIKAFDFICELLINMFLFESCRKEEANKDIKMSNQAQEAVTADNTAVQNKKNDAVTNKSLKEIMPSTFVSPLITSIIGGKK